MPSPVIVTDRQTLIDNFTQNSVEVLCQASLGAGAYAIGGALLGFPPTSLPAALVTGSALLAALTLCPASGNQNDIFGTPPGYTGGQCNTRYTVRALDRQVNAGTCSVIANEEEIYSVLGPIRLTREVVGNTGPVPCAGNASFDLVRIKLIGSDGTVHSNLTLPVGLSGADFTITSVTRNDGLPDDCGNAPSDGGQIITNNVTGDTIDNSTVTNNSSNFTVIPVVINVGGVNGTLNLNFGPIQIEKLLPLEFNIDIGGANFKFREKPDGTFEPIGTNPDKESPDDKLEKLVREIKECVCNPEVKLENLFVPYVNSQESCDIETLNLAVPEDSVSSESFAKLVRSAADAAAFCNTSVVEQLPEEQIFAATITGGGGEIFTGEIDTNVVSLRVKVTEFNESLLPKIGLYPDSNQRKFGSVAFVGSGVSGGGDYIYVFDTDTYVPLPKRGKKGKLRILFKPGTSFIVFDTGERI